MAFLGDWRSWLARLTGSQKVTGSNPVFSTLIANNKKGNLMVSFFILFSKYIYAFTLSIIDNSSN